MRPLFRAISVFACVLGLSGLCGIARADTKDQCASGSEQAQRLIKQGKFIEARAQLLVCTRVECPAIVKQDCDGWLSNLDATIPSLVVAARDEDGRDLLELKVMLDGAPVDSLNGVAIPVNPGVHKLRVEAAGRIPSESQVVVHEGERARPVTVTLLSATPKERPAPPPVIVKEPGTSPFVYVFGTLAGVGLASFATFEIKAAVDASHLRSTCAPHCSQDDVDRVSTGQVVANVSLIAGAAFAGGAFAIWYFGKKGSPTAPAAAFEITPVWSGPAAAGTRIGVHGVF